MERKKKIPATNEAKWIENGSEMHWQAGGRSSPPVCKPSFSLAT